MNEHPLDGRESGDEQPPAVSHHRLTDDELAAICEAAPTRPYEALHSLWTALVPGWTTAPVDTLKPWLHTIPKEQWHEIGLALSKHSVEACLELVNRGPSAVEEES